MPVTPKRRTTEAKVSAPKRREAINPLPESTVEPVVSAEPIMAKSTPPSAASTPVPCAKDVALLIVRQQKAEETRVKQEIQRRQDEYRARACTYVETRKSDIEKNLEDPTGWDATYTKLLFHYDCNFSFDGGQIVCSILAQRYPSFKFTYVCNLLYVIYASIPEHVRLDAIAQVAKEGS